MQITSNEIANNKYVQIYLTREELEKQETKEIIEQVIMPRVSVQKVLHYCTTHDVGFTMHTKTRQLKINNPKDIIEDVLSLTLTSTNYERMKIMKNMLVR